MPVFIGIAIFILSSISHSVVARPLIETLPVEQLCRYTESTLPSSQRQVEMAWRWQATRIRFNPTREQCQMRIVVQVSPDALYRQVIRDMEGLLTTEEQAQQTVNTRGYRQALRENIVEYFERRFQALDTNDEAFSIDLRATFTDSQHRPITHRLFVQEL